MRVYVGTYGKYNSGNLYGAWLDIEDYADRDEFYDACKELHAMESDPEFMFQDWEDIPNDLISESSIDEKVFELAALDESDREMWAAYIGNCGDADFETARDAFRGKYDSPSDFGMEYAVDSGMIDDNHPMFSYIDWEHYSRELLMSGFFENDGYYFYDR